MDDAAVSALLDDLAHLDPLGPWVSDAACRGLAEVFTERPAHRDELAVIERVCRRCPVRAECLASPTRAPYTASMAGCGTPVS